MKLECDREQDVLDAIAAARWPERCDDELRAHVEGCEVCADLAEILGPISADRDAAWSDASVPPAGVVWWRAQLRARDEVLRAATRPLTAVYALALVVAGAIGGGLFVAALPRLRVWAAATAGSMHLPSTADLQNLVLPLAGSSLALLVIATWLLTPLILWLGLRDDAAD